MQIIENVHISKNQGCVYCGQPLVYVDMHKNRHLKKDFIFDVVESVFGRDTSYARRKLKCSRCRLIYILAGITFDKYSIKSGQGFYLVIMHDSKKRMAERYIKKIK